MHDVVIPREDAEVLAADLANIATTMKWLQRTAAIMTAWQAGELSEGQATRLMNCDRLELRELRDKMFKEAAEEWTAFRAANPVEVKETETQSLSTMIRQGIDEAHAKGEMPDTEYAEWDASFKAEGL